MTFDERRTAGGLPTGYTLKNKKKQAPLKSIRAKCGDCMCGSLKEVRACHLAICPLHPYRLGRRPEDGPATRTPVKSMRGKCLECSSGSYDNARNCPIQDCPLWPYRMGCRPETLEAKSNRPE